MQLQFGLQLCGPEFVAMTCWHPYDQPQLPVNLGRAVGHFLENSLQLCLLHLYIYPPWACNSTTHLPSWKGGLQLRCMVPPQESLAASTLIRAWLWGHHVWVF